SCFFFSSRRRHTRFSRDWSSDVCSSDLLVSTSACHDCHTPWTLTEHGPAPDMSRALSGHPESLEMPDPPALSGPWVMTTGATNRSEERRGGQEWRDGGLRGA